MSGARDLVGRLHASEGSRLKGLFRARPRVPQDAACLGLDAERLIAAWQTLALLARAIRQLPRRCRQVLIPGRLHVLPNGEIAAKSPSANITPAGRTYLTGLGVDWPNSFYSQPRTVSLALTKSF